VAAVESIWIPIILMALGTIALFLEAFVPSGGLISVVAVSLIVAAVVLTFMHHGQTLGVLFTALGVVLVPTGLILGFYFLRRSPMGRRLMLSRSQTAESGYVVQGASAEQLMGRTGVTVSMLRPSGVARIDGRRYDVLTNGEMIEKGAEIEVRDVSGNNIVVRRRRTT
jgi:membrane-bound serine protease (ClpP class)